jgi:hypothetical protein
VRSYQRSGRTAPHQLHGLTDSQLAILGTLSQEHAPSVLMHVDARRTFALQEQDDPVRVMHGVPPMDNRRAELGADDLTPAAHYRVEVAAYPCYGTIVPYTAGKDPAASRIDHRADALETGLPLVVDLPFVVLPLAKAVQFYEGLKVHGD